MVIIRCEGEKRQDKKEGRASINKGRIKIPSHKIKFRPLFEEGSTALEVGEGGAGGVDGDEEGLVMVLLRELLLMHVVLINVLVFELSVIMASRTKGAEGIQGGGEGGGEGAGEEGVEGSPGHRPEGSRQGVSHGG